MPRGVDLTGEQKGFLFVIEDSGERTKGGEKLWKTRCICGSFNNYKTSRLTSGDRTSCGCRGRKAIKPIANKIKEKVRRMKGKDHLKSLDDLTHYNILQEYCNGSSVNQLSDKYLVSPDELRVYVRNFRDDLNSAFELQYLCDTTKTNIPVDTINKTISTTFIQDNLLDKLSSDTSTTLTKEEVLYSWIYANSGSSLTALKESGLNEVLKKQDKAHLNLLGVYLREKPNVAKYIKDLQLKNISDTDVTKEFVQSELIQQIQQLKELVSFDDGNQRGRGALLKSIELLGRTVGSFQDNIKIEKINPSDALDELIEMAKANPIKSTYTITEEDA